MADNLISSVNLDIVMARSLDKGNWFTSVLDALKGVSFSLKTASSFVPGAATTWSTKHIALPQNWFSRTDLARRALLCHEGRHILQRRNVGDTWFSIKYVASANYRAQMELAAHRDEVHYFYSLGFRYWGQGARSTGESVTNLVDDLKENYYLFGVSDKWLYDEVNGIYKAAQRIWG